MEHTLSYGGRGENVPYRGEWSRREESKLNVPNENGEPTAVIVPIELWREIESERETPYLLTKVGDHEGAALAAKQVQDGIPFEAAIEKLGIRSGSLRGSRLVG